MMICLLWDTMDKNNRKFVNDLIRASIFDIVRPNEMDRSIKEDMFIHIDDVITVYENDMIFLPHIYNDACLVKNDGTFRCRKNRQSQSQTIQNKCSYPFQMIILCLVF